MERHRTLGSARVFALLLTGAMTALACLGTSAPANAAGPAADPTVKAKEKVRIEEESRLKEQDADSFAKKGTRLKEQYEQRITYMLQSGADQETIKVLRDAADYFKNETDKVRLKIKVREKGEAGGPPEPKPALLR